MVFASTAREIGRLIRGALPFAIVNNTPGGIIANAVSFRNINDAVSSGAEFIYICPGTYDEAMLIDRNNVIVLGSGRSTHIRNLTDTSKAPCHFSNASNCIVAFCSFEAPGGGVGGGTNSVVISGAENIFVFNYVRDSDAGAIFVNGARNLIIGNLIEDADGSGMDVSTLADNSVIIANHLTTVDGANSIDMNVGADNSVVVGNIGDKAFSDSSTSSTFANNEEY